MNKKVDSQNAKYSLDKNVAIISSEAPYIMDKDWSRYCRLMIFLFNKKMILLYKQLTNKKSTYRTRQKTGTAIKKFEFLQKKEQPKKI